MLLCCYYAALTVCWDCTIVFIYSGVFAVYTVGIYVSTYQYHLYIDYADSSLSSRVVTSAVRVLIIYSRRHNGYKCV